MDGSGNVLLTGSFRGTADFDPGSGTESITSLGSDDVFVVKLNSSGQLVWAKSVGGTGNDQGAAVAVDDSGNVYVAGSFSGTADFDPDSGTANVSAVGFEDGFVMKLDADGAYQWAKQIGGTGPEYARGIAVDSSGNVFTTGYFQGSVDFDPGSATSTLASAGGNDAFLQKLDSDGNYDWAIRLGSAANDEGYSVTTDISDNVLVHGIFQGTVDFDPGAGADSRTTTGSYAAYILKLDSSGGFVWVSVFVAGRSPVFSSSRGKSIAVDGSDNVYTTGYFEGTADFDPSAGSSNLTSAGNWDVYVTKLDSSGALQWARALGGSMDDYGRSIAVDGSGNVYTTGEFNDSADFDPGPGSLILSSPGGTDDHDVFVSKLNSSGSFVWAKSFVGTDAGCSPFDESCDNYREDASGIGTDSSGNVYSSGYFSYPVDFDPGTGTDTLSSAGSSDVFLVKMSAAGVTAAPPTISYSASTLSLSTSQTMTPLTPTVTGTVSTWSISPPLPSGLTLDPSTGIISGTPLASQAPTVHTITATNIAGSDSVGLTLEVIAPPTALSYPVGAVELRVNRAMSVLTPTVTGIVTSWSVSPALPTGVTLDPSSGALSGTPTAPTLSGSYTITATNSAGTATFSMTFTFDTTAPTVTVTRAGDGTLADGDTDTVTFTLSEATTDFTAADVTVTGGTLSGFAGSGLVYTATFTPTPDTTATASVSVASATFTDGAGNPNLASAALTFGVDTTTTTTTTTTPPASTTSVASPPAAAPAAPVVALIEMPSTGVALAKRSDGVEVRSEVTVESSDTASTITIRNEDGSEITVIHEPTLIRTNFTVYRGTSLTISGDGYLPGTDIDVWLNSSPTYLGTTTTTADGTFTFEVVIPGDFELGDHVLQVEGTVLADVEQATFIGLLVLDRTVPELPATGREASTSLPALLLAIGLMLTIGVSRRRTDTAHH